MEVRFAPTCSPAKESIGGDFVEFWSDWGIVIILRRLFMEAWGCAFMEKRQEMKFCGGKRCLIRLETSLLRVLQGEIENVEVIPSTLSFSRRFLPPITAGNEPMGAPPFRPYHPYKALSKFPTGGSSYGSSHRLSTVQFAWSDVKLVRFKL